MGHGEWGESAGTAVARVQGQLWGRGRVSHRLGQPAGLHGVQSPNGRRAAAESTEAAPAAAGSSERVSTVLRVQWRALRAGQAAAIAAEEGSGRTSERRRSKYCDGSRRFDLRVGQENRVRAAASGVAGCVPMRGACMVAVAGALEGSGGGCVPAATRCEWRNARTKRWPDGRWRAAQRNQRLRRVQAIGPDRAAARAGTGAALSPPLNAAERGF